MGISLSNNNDYLIHPSIVPGVYLGIGALVLAATGGLKSSNSIINVIATTTLVNTGVDVLSNYTMVYRSPKFFRTTDTKKLLINTQNRLITAIFISISNSLSHPLAGAASLLGIRNFPQTFPKVAVATTMSFMISLFLFSNVSQAIVATSATFGNLYFAFYNRKNFCLVSQLSAKQALPYIVASSLLQFVAKWTYAELNHRASSNSIDADGNDRYFRTCTTQRTPPIFVSSILASLNTVALNAARIRPA